MEEKISIIIPVYNCADFLGQCLDSVLAQTYQNIEVIAINDGSTDDSLRILHEYEQRDGRVRVFDQPNSGISRTRNRGVEEAEGSYIVFVDGDDRLAEDMIRQLYTAMMEHSAQVVRCNYSAQGSKDGQLFDLADRKVNKEEMADILPHFITNRQNIPCYCWLLMIRKDCVPAFDTELKFMEDTHFFIRLLMQVDSVFFLDRKLYYYRYNTASVSKDVARVEGNIDGMWLSVQKIRDFLREKGLLDASLEKRMDACLFSLMISKFKLLTEQRLPALRRELKSLCRKESVRRVLANAYRGDIPKKILPEYYLLQGKLYLGAALILKVKKMLKGHI